MHDGELILVAGGLLAAGIGAVLVAETLRVPGLVIFLGLGMLIGTDGLGWIDFNNAEMARTIGIIALCLILFEGGLLAGWDEIRPVAGAAIALATVGTLLTMAIAGFAAKWIFDLSTLEGMLLGATIAVTDGAAIFSLLRGSSLKRRLALVLEGESGFNDAIAVMLVIGLIEAIQQPGYGVADFASLLAAQIAIGVVVGVAVGIAGVWVFKKLDFATPGLYPVASITIVALAFGLAETVGGSGFLAVYLAGLVLGSRPIPARRTVTAFHQGLAWVGQIALFFTLGLLVFPTQFGNIAWEALLLAGVLMLVARPVATLISLQFSGFNVRERVLIGWAGLRGAVPIVLATFPVIEGIPGSNQIFNIVFFVVVSSTLIQGATFEPLARLFGLTTAEPALPQPVSEVGAIKGLGAEVVEFPVRQGSELAGLHVRNLGLPREALVSVIVRDGEAIPPRGSTIVEVGDRLHIVVRHEYRVEVEKLLGQ